MLAALSTVGLVSGPLKALGVHAGAMGFLRHLPSISHSRGLSSNGRHSSVYITDVDNNPTSHMPLLLGLVNYFERHMPYGEGGICLQQCPAASTAGHPGGVYMAGKPCSKCLDKMQQPLPVLLCSMRTSHTFFRTRYNARCMCVLFLGN